MTYTHDHPKKQPVDIVAAFEPCRAVLRPKRCDERDGCWVKIGPPGCGHPNSGPRCLACDGGITVAGLEQAHAQALLRCSGIAA